MTVKQSYERYLSDGKSPMNVSVVTFPVFLSRVLTATFGSNRRGTLPPDFGHYEMKSAVTMSCLGLLVECMQHPREARSDGVGIETDS
jgi:hypothetical protein